MLKNKYLNFTLILLLIIAGYFLTAAAFPKNLNRYPFFIILLLTDLYLWTYVKKRVFTYNKLIRNLTAGLYWMPMALLSALVVAAWLVPQNNWPSSIRIYLFGSVFIFFTAKILSAIILFLMDFIKLLARLVRLISKRAPALPPADVSNNMNRGRFIENIAYLSGGLIIGTMFTGMFKWVHDFRLHTLDIRLGGLSNGFEGFRIVQISDLHLGSWANESLMAKAVEMINDQNPDLVVFTGDLVNYSTDEAYRFKSILAGIEAKNGVTAILGNHDYGDYMNWPSRQEKKQNFDALVRFYNDLGWRLLKNENFVIENNGSKLGIIGVENWSANTRFPQYGNIEKAAKGMGKVDAKILLSHDPSHWSQQVLVNHKDINLMLAGHTHGFQFGFEIPGLKWSPAQYMYQEWAGLYTDNTGNQHLYVNRGLGSVGYPGRIGILPEITVLNIIT